MTKLVVAITAALVLILASLPVNAHGKGFSHAGLHRGHAKSPVPFYGYGAITMPSYAPEPMATYVTPVVIQPPRGLNCQRSREVVTVPSEDGGTRDIAVTRC